MKLEAATRLVLTSGRSDQWWASLTPKQQKEYLALHPRSKYGKGTSSKSPTKKSAPAPEPRKPRFPPLSNFEPPVVKGPRRTEDSVPTPKGMNQRVNKVAPIKDMGKKSADVLKTMKPASHGYSGETQGYTATDEQYKSLKDSLKSEGWNLEDHGSRGAMFDKDGSIISVSSDNRGGYNISIKDRKS